MRPAFPRHVGIIRAALASSGGAGARADGCLSYRRAGVANEHTNLAATGWSHSSVPSSSHPRSMRAALRPLRHLLLLQPQRLREWKRKKMRRCLSLFLSCTIIITYSIQVSGLIFRSMKQKQLGNRQHKYCFCTFCFVIYGWFYIYSSS